MNDMSTVIIPRSDQINADSLLSGPITIKITKVEIKAVAEQPVTIHYEGEDGKPWRPCKSMARCLVAAWGPDSSKYAGRSLTLFCDPHVKWAGLEVGGIRISHMSDIDGPLTMALTVTRANKKPFTVKPLETTKPVEDPMVALKKKLWLLTSKRCGGDKSKLRQFLIDEALIDPAAPLEQLSESDLRAVIAKTEQKLNPGTQPALV